MAEYYAIDKSTTTDVWLTPPDLLNKLGKFDLDPCCPKDMPWKTAENSYSLENNQDGLVLPWNGRIWLNPPYSDWVPFLEKLSIHDNGIALIFARTETKGFFDFIWERADSILFIKRRLKFCKQDGKPSGKGNTTPSVLIAYGKDNTLSLLNSSIEGKLIVLKN